MGHNGGAVVRAQLLSQGLSQSDLGFQASCLAPATVERYESTIIELCKFAHSRDSCAFATEIGLAFVASRKTTGLKRNARNTVSFLDKLSTKAGIMHYILRAAQMTAPIRPKYKDIFDISVLFRWLYSLGPVQNMDLPTARLRSKCLMLCDTLGRQELLFKAHRVAFKLKNPAGLPTSELEVSSGFFRIKTWRPGDNDSTPPILIKGFGPKHRWFRLSTPHNLYQYFRLMIPKGKIMTIDDVLSTIPEHETIFRKLDGSGPLEKISINSQLSRALRAAGIDPKYKVHSTRAATATKAFLAGVPMQQILLRGAWKSEATFREWYLKLSREVPKSVDRDLSIEAALRADL